MYGLYFAKIGFVFLKRGAKMKYFSVILIFLSTVTICFGSVGLSEQAMIPRIEAIKAAEDVNSKSAIELCESVDFAVQSALKITEVIHTTPIGALSTRQIISLSQAYEKLNQLKCNQ